MKSSKRFCAVMTLLLLVGCVCLLVQCSPDQRDADRETVIALVNLQTHPILDAVQQGVLDELKKNSLVDGEGTRLVIRNANGDMQRVAAIASEVRSQNPDVVVAISTPIAQAIVQAYDGFIVFGALTDPVGAGVLKTLDGANPNITGTTDALPYEEQLKLVRRIVPAAKRLGLLFSPGEAASQHALKEVKRVAPGLGFELIEGPVNSTNEVFPVAQNIADKVDVFLISTDNTVAAGIAGAVKVAIEQKIPLFACDSGSVEKGAIAAVSPGYYDIGIETGKLVVRVLAGDRNIPVVSPKGGDIYINRKAAEQMGVDIPQDVMSEATKVFEAIE